ncbi:histidine kinase [Actinotignum sanguinis]|nr:histidine kinase [Actinotignum sanguinis]
MRQTRQELARQLHDTTAKDLAHIAILAQDIAIRHPDLSEELDKLVKVATSASRRIRPLILSMDTTATETPLSEVITQVTNMLRTRDITLEVNINGDIDTLTTRQQRRTAALAIRECASNILKYAPAGSEANLVIEVTTAPNLLALSLSNQIASQPQTSHMSSGYGLANLANRIRTEGGTIQSKAVDQQWITYITLPAHASVPLETTSTQTAIPKE